MKFDKYMNWVLDTPLEEIVKQHPVCRDFFLNYRIHNIETKLTLSEILEKAGEDILTEFGMDADMVLRDFVEFLTAFVSEAGEKTAVKTLTILGGCDKSGMPELLEWSVSVGETIGIVGPTGSGKSRLLADIECLADRDTPTGRKILVDGRELSEEERYQMEGKLVAQLSQNMNFVMDLTVREFLEMHARSRLSSNMDDTVKRCFDSANELAGEKFGWGVKVTQLSGGQSRALMIADTAYMSTSPIVLIDEIENAGIDRRQAIEILAKKEKIVLISTHDPLLALSADKRIVIKNGGVSAILIPSEEEKICLHAVEKLDTTLSKLRNSLRRGEEIKRELLE
jgi:ABC-type lipoprotein export system ATPase subunit